MENSYYNDTGFKASAAGAYLGYLCFLGAEADPQKLVRRTTYADPQWLGKLFALIRTTNGLIPQKTEAELRRFIEDDGIMLALMDDIISAFLGEISFSSIVESCAEVCERLTGLEASAPQSAQSIHDLLQNSIPTFERMNVQAEEAEITLKTYKDSLILSIFPDAIARRYFDLFSIETFLKEEIGNAQEEYFAQCIYVKMLLLECGDLDRSPTPTQQMINSLIEQMMLKITPTERESVLLTAARNILGTSSDS